MSLTSSLSECRRHLRTKLQNKPPPVPKDTLDFPLTESIYIPSQDWSPSSFTSLESPISVSEILDSELLGEGLIPSLQHAHDILLVESPEMVSYRATTYGQLVESTFLWKLRDLRSNKAEVSDGIHLVLTGFEDVLGVKPQQYAFHCDAIADEVKPLSEPFKIFEFYFSKRPQSRGETELSIKATNEGRVHAVISWWILQLDREWTIFYSTAPRWINLPANINNGWFNGCSVF
ncbi:protein arginine N-methyltransferase 1.6-like isoform X2 [Rosa rugosa]|uniref:protein arginine N-methyltransferase 1.6-like isoform X2 n=1 Tax=Rosa rugosa TaxID=74645 RepID=UPI002B40ECE5|nr:protein arginine N-methyltransferase 1.6-like isoform X2 [Rosa rugosa]XP_062027393.1 protein arginine N-methyltransferase 1.6-like isoform X2 [Rosa rugosa]